MEHLADPQGRVTLRRFTPPHPVVPRPIECTPIYAAALDVETTGLEPLTSEVIELAIQPFEFDLQTGCLLKLHPPFHSFQQPKQPVPANITEITGLTDADLAGHRIDWTEALAVLRPADVLIAHNAGFDRQHVETAIFRWNPQAAFEVTWAQKRWGCSQRDVDWSQLRAPGEKLSVLCLWHGFWFRAHRATDDVDALLELLRVGGRLPELYAKSMQPAHEVWAWKSTFESKDRLKERKYRWNAARKCWVTTVVGTQAVQDELAWLQAAVYGAQKSEARVERLEPWQRYK